MIRRKTVSFSLAALAATAALVWAMLPSPLPVSAVVAERGPFVEFVEDEGRASVRDPYVVSAPISAYLRRVALEPGDSVAEGDVVFELEPMPSPALDPRAREQARDAEAAGWVRVARAEAERQLAQAQRSRADAEYLRHVELAAEGFISTERLEALRSERDARRAAERAAAHAVEVARFELEVARAALAVTDGTRVAVGQPVLAVRAPIGGVVVERHRCCEGPVAAGEPVLDVGDLDTLEVRIDLLSMDAVRVRPGIRVVLERWGGEPLEGRVRRVEPRGFERVSALGVEEQRVPVWVTIESPREDWAALGQGYRVEGRFILWAAEDVLQVPTSALFRVGDRWQVFVVESGRARLRAVTPGRRSGLSSEILDGLEEGEVVVSHPGDRIADGVRVAPEMRP